MKTYTTHNFMLQAQEAGRIALALDRDLRDAGWLCYGGLWEPPMCLRGEEATRKGRRCVVGRAVEMVSIMGALRAVKAHLDAADVPSLKVLWASDMEEAAKLRKAFPGVEVVLAARMPRDDKEA